MTVRIAGGSAAQLQRYLYDPAAPPADGLPIGPSASHPGGASLVRQDTLPPRGVAVWATQWEAGPPPAGRGA